MATEILKSFSHLQNELEEAKSSLKGVDANIKRLIGRDPSELAPRPGQKRPNIQDDKNSRLGPKINRRSFENEEASKRRNPNTVSVFKRLSDKIYEEPVKTQPKGLISKVIAAPKEVPSRQEVLDKQNKDEKFKARNRRMFGALLGTLQRFQQEESKLKKKEEKRTQIEKKIEEHELQEKEEIKKERQGLFLNRKKKQQEIKMIELKMLRMKEYAAWEESQRPRTNFIVTKVKPHIHYLPRKMDDKAKELLEKSKANVKEQIEKRRQAVFEELSHIEERMKKNFDAKNNVETKEEVPSERHIRHGSDSDVDDDGDIKMKSPPPESKDGKEGSQDIVKIDEGDSKAIDGKVTENGSVVPPANLEGEAQCENSESHLEDNQNSYILPETKPENNVQSDQSIKDHIYEHNTSLNSFNVAVMENINVQHQVSEVVNQNVSEEVTTGVPNVDI